MITQDEFRQLILKEERKGRYRCPRTNFHHAQLVVMAALEEQGIETSHLTTY